MRIAIGLYGFLGEILNTDDILKISNAVPYCNEGIDIFYYGPTIIHESNQNELDMNNIELQYKNAKLGNVYFTSYKYNPTKFINIVKNIGLPKQLADGIYSYRLFSMIFNLENTIKLIKSSNISYDYIIIMRNDYITHIPRFNELFNNDIIKDSLYIFRKDYVFPDDIDGLIHNVEDRIIYGDSNSIYKLIGLYDTLFTIDITNPTLNCSEYIIKYYVRNKFNKSHLHTQSFANPWIPVVPLNKEFKRSYQMKQIVDEYYRLSEL